MQGLAAPRVPSYRSGLLAGIVSGLLVALSIPPFGWWPLAWLGLAIMAAVLPGRPWRSRLLAGAAFGLADYVPGLYWVHEFSIPGYIAVVVVSSLYVVAAVGLTPASRMRYIALAWPCLFTMSDWARDRFPLGGLPLGGLSLGQVAGPLRPVLRLGGSLALTWATVLAGVSLAAVALWAWSWVRHPEAMTQSEAGIEPFPARWLAVLGGGGRPSGARAGRPTGARAGAARAGAGAVVLVVVTFLVPVGGALSPSGAGGDLPPLQIALVQGGGPRGTRAINTDPQVVFDRHLAASVALRDPLQLVVWPEGVLQSRSNFAATADAAEVAGLARALHTTMLVGVEQDVGTSRYLNEVVAWGPNGQIGGSYVKNHLVPFGEYVPYRSLIQKLFNVADVPRDAIPGHGPGFLRTPAAPLAVMISYEVFFDERARGGVRAGGQLLVVPTNTASYRSTQVPTQEVAADRMRAVETGRWLIQVTPTGYSTVVTPDGQVVQRSHLDSRTVVFATVGRRTGMTVYDHIGDTPVVVVAVLAWLAVLGAGLNSRRRRDQEATTAPAGVPLRPLTGTPAPPSV